MYSSLFIIFSVLGLGQALVAMPPVRRALEPFAPSRLGRAAVGLAVALVALWAGSKGPSPAASRVSQFVTALRSGVVIDESGVVARASEAAVLDAYTSLSASIVSAAAGAVAAASNDFISVAALVTNSQRSVIYIASDLPRAAARQWTNHNIAATVERARQSPDASVVHMWVWYSDEPAVAPGMRAEIDVGGGWQLLEAVTNSYPQTELVGGVPCVRYDFAVPPPARGVVFRPEYEIAFGSEHAPLVVPSGGVSVETNGAALLPYSGADSYFGGRVGVTYRGGVAVSMTIDGQAVSNGVYSL